MEYTDQIFKRENTMGILEQLAEIKHQEGVDEGIEQTVRSAIVNTNLTNGEIAKMLDVPISLVKKIRAELKSESR